MAGRYNMQTYVSPDRKERVCLKCPRTFMSWGKGNRICRQCRNNFGMDNQAYRVDSESNILVTGQKRKRATD